MAAFRCKIVSTLAFFVCRMRKKREVKKTLMVNQNQILLLVPLNAKQSIIKKKLFF